MNGTLINDEELENVSGGGEIIDKCADIIESRGELIRDDFKGPVTAKKIAHYTGKSLGTGVIIAATAISGTVSKVKKKFFDWLF